MTNKMWGGRFATGPDAIMARINASIDFDRKLFAQDIAGSKAHAAMLVKQKIISSSDAAAIAKGAPHPGNAHAYINWICDAKVNAEIALGDVASAAADFVNLRGGPSSSAPILAQDRR